MKKTIIGVAIAAAIGLGGYIGMNKAGDVAEQQLTSFINEHKNQPFTIEYLESSPLIKKAQWQVTDSNDNHIKSVLLIELASSEQIEIPLNSEIIRGKVEYNGTNYGFGKIITHPDLSQLKELPDNITEDTFTSTQYIGLAGNIVSVDSIGAIKNDTFDFQGLVSEVHTSLLNTDNLDISFNSKKITLQEDNNTVLVSPLSMTIKTDKAGEYIGESLPFSLTVQEGSREPLQLEFSNGVYHGSYKNTDALIVPISNTYAKYDSIIFTADAMPVKLTNAIFEGGFYEAGEDLANLKVALTTDFDAQAMKDSGILQAAHITFTPEHFSLEYNFNSIGYDVINRYYGSIAKIYSEDPLVLQDNPDLSQIFSDEDVTEMLGSIQKSDAQFNAAINFRATEGKAHATAEAKLSELGKKLSVEEMNQRLNRPETTQEIIDAKANIIIDEVLANATGMSMMLELMLGTSPENGKYTVDAQVKDGKTTINGQIMP